MTTAKTAARVQTHVSIATSDLARSADFYRALLGEPPVLRRADYVRFWPAELGLVVGLNAAPAASAVPTGSLQHLGLLFPDAAALAAARARLAAAGFASTGAEHVECCYAELDQFWATDPSGVEWELFLAHEVEVEPAAAAAGACCAPSCCS